MPDKFSLTGTVFPTAAKVITGLAMAMAKCHRVKWHINIRLKA